MLRIADSAKNRIVDLCADFRRDKGVDAIPAIMWLDGDLNDGRFPSGVLLGAYTAAQRDEVAHGIRISNGVEYVLAVSEHDLFKFLGKTLTFDGSLFHLE
ncbi:MAG: hypothetical protein E5W27_03270 [Mesorhizobium sp.]|nr:MAG: hypothetical protein E5W27_03270 [Mesorhizobium sp.]